MQLVSITLEDTFGFWRANESWNPKWQAVAKEKGFSDWESWRRKFLERLHEATYPAWTVEMVEHPLEVVPHWYGGPFASWIENVYSGAQTMQFSRIVEQPFVQNHDYIPGLVADFPKLTVLSVVEDEEGKVTVVEGMHRACALTMLAQSSRGHDGLVFVAKGKLKPGAELHFAIKSE